MRHFFVVDGVESEDSHDCTFVMVFEVGYMAQTHIELSGYICDHVVEVGGVRDNVLGWN